MWPAPIGRLGPIICNSNSEQTPTRPSRPGRWLADPLHTTAGPAGPIPPQATTAAITTACSQKWARRRPSRSRLFAVPGVSHCPDRPRRLTPSARLSDAWISGLSTGDGGKRIIGSDKYFNDILAYIGMAPARRLKTRGLVRLLRRVGPDTEAQVRRPTDAANFTSAGYRSVAPACGGRGAGARSIQSRAGGYRVPLGQGSGPDWRSAFRSSPAGVTSPRTAAR